MSSPAKRRKKNGYNGSDQPVRGLDYFFAKQREAVKGAGPANKTLEKGNDASDDGKKGDAVVLTDEELARKLQEEWNNEGRDASVGSSGERNATTGQPPKDDIEQEKLETKTDISKKDIRPSNTLGFAPSKQNTLALQSTAADEDTVCASIPFDQSPLEFEPSKYIQDLQKHWAADGGHATYALLTRAFVLVNSTQSRIKIVDTLVNLLRCVIEGDPGSLLPAVSISGKFCWI